jgi:predicted nucleotidyltransferase
MTTSPLTPLEASIVARIAREAGAQPAAAAVWLFGSRARGASTEFSDLDVAVEFSSAETPALRAWLEGVRREAEAPVADQWPGFVNLVGLYVGDVDSRLARRVRAEGLILWRRSTPVGNAASAASPRTGEPART